MASYPPPNNQQGTIFNTIDWIIPNAGSIDTAYLNEHYCQFPVAQGSMSFAGINNTGSTTIKQNLVMTGTYNTNFLEFPDGTKQYTASAGSDILNTNNTFVGVNNFFPPIQNFGSTLNEGLTFTNNQYINGSGDTDIIAYIPDSTTGLCIFALTTNSASFATPQIQLLPDGTASNFQASAVNGIVSIISNNTGGTIQLKSDAGVQLVHNASLKFSTYGTLTGSSTGLSSSVNFTSPSITTPSITQTTDDADMTITCSGLNSAIVLNSTAGVLIEGNPVLSFPPYGQISADSSGLTSSVSLYVPTQTTYNNGTTYGNSTATQAFVKSAVNSISGGGDVYLSSSNLFTGLNNFNNNNNGTTISNIGLSIGGNTQVGYAEADIICINQTTNVGLNIYAESTSITSTTVPKIQIFNDDSGTVFNSSVVVETLSIAGNGTTNLINYGGGLTSDSSIILPTQSAYSASTTYTNTASSQAFVQSAVNSIITTGIATLGGENNFSGLNTYNYNAPTTTLVQTFPSNSTTHFATIGYVNSLSTSSTNNNAFTAVLGVNGGVSQPNTLTLNVLGSSVFFSGALSFYSNNGATKFTFSISPAIPNIISNFQSYSLYDASTSQYISINVQQSIIATTSLIIQLNTPTTAINFYDFTFSGSSTIQ